MNDVIEIKPCGPIRGAVQPPGSKSITNRALVCAALASGQSHLTGVLDSEDTRVMVDCLVRLGFQVPVDWTAADARVVGLGGTIPAKAADLFVGNSGTTVRFLTAVVALGTGEYRLDGVPRMRERPLGDLLAALAQAGIDARSELGNDCPPVLVKARGLAGGTLAVRGDISSQFLSGLLLAAPLARAPVEIVVEGPLVSQPYVRMTTAVMNSFGANVQTSNDLSRFRIDAPRPYTPSEYAIEPDASAASYFWGAAAVTGGEVTVRGLSRGALQGDVAFCDVLEKMGCTVIETREGMIVQGGRLKGVTVNMNAISDTVQTLAAVALFAEGTTTISGVGHIRHKETDRIGDLARELRKLGAKVTEREDGLSITPGPLHGATIQTYRDHRMAMSLSLVGLRVSGVRIGDPGCTAKTYPRFFDDLAAICRAAK